MTRSFDVIFDLRRNKRLNKQSGRRWFEAPSSSLWRHCNAVLVCFSRQDSLDNRCGKGGFGRLACQWERSGGGVWDSISSGNKPWWAWKERVKDPRVWSEGESDAYLSKYKIIDPYFNLAIDLISIFLIKELKMISGRLNARWRHISGSILAQIMPCCLMVLSHYLNQRPLLINDVMWHSSESNFKARASATIELGNFIKSPRYTGGDFMFLYRFVRRRRRHRSRRRRRPQVLVHAITFEQLFGFLSFLAQLLALTYRLTD